MKLIFLAKVLIKVFIVIIAMSFGSIGVYSQDIKLTNEPPTSKRFDHFIGLQGNLLFREFFNFGGETGDIENPYLLTYTLRSSRTGLAINTGFGYNSFQRENDDGLKVTEQITDIRVGPGYQVRSGKFEFGVGIDGIYRGRSIDTFTQQIVELFNFVDSTVAVTRSSITGYGLGVQATCRFYLSERFLIGTEASFSYLKEEEKFNAENASFITSENENFTNYQVVNEKADVDSWQFKLPVVIYLIVKF